VNWVGPKLKKNIAILVDSFYPEKSSAAIQMFELAKTFVRQGHQITIFTPSSSMPGKNAVSIDSLDGMRVVSIRVGKRKGVSLFARAFREVIMPVVMIRNLSRITSSIPELDYVVWYSPSIFVSFVAKYLATKFRCSSYLIVRDIFPKWAVDIGILRKGLPYYIFRWVEVMQYRFADQIGVQSDGDVAYFKSDFPQLLNKVEVLHNWRDRPLVKECELKLEDTTLRGRKIFVYAGNLGKAQNLIAFIEAAGLLFARSDIGFLFIGGGTEAEKMRDMVDNMRLSNVLILDEIAHELLPSLYEQCQYGVVSLDTKLTNHNIPGKFLSYIHAKLPIFASINPDNDLEKIIDNSNLGVVVTSGQATDIADAIVRLTDMNFDRDQYSANCDKLISEMFSPARASLRILRPLFSETE